MYERAWCNSDQKSVRDAEAVKFEQRIFHYSFIIQPIKVDNLTR